jgi:hypothetical protein
VPLAGRRVHTPQAGYYRRFRLYIDVQDLDSRLEGAITREWQPKTIPSRDAERGDYL